MELTVQLKHARLGTDEVQEFLSSKVKGEVDSHGSELRIQDIKAKEIKLLLHKYLHQRGLDSFRVEVVHPGLIEVLGPEPPKPHFVRDTGGSAPTVGASMPWLFPSSPALQGSPVKKQKKQRK